jgi:hypothetical protein
MFWHARVFNADISKWTNAAAAMSMIEDGVDSEVVSISSLCSKAL